ncbi:MAG: hypothetical protein OXJ62_02760 [Spirochaetaceae bacterium]|nr:hypothetical protein [Spirochaetaceae bacterium]
MSATTITTIEDLVRLLDEKPEWLEALRTRLLTRELLELPQQLAEFAATTNLRFEEVDRRFEAVDRRFDGVDRRLDQLTKDMAPLKAAHARDAALREADLIAEQSGLTFMRTLTYEQIGQLVRSADTFDVPVNELRSFRRADLIAETHDSSGTPCYLAAEISFTANGRDTRRAIRNAGLLERFTGRRAHPMVAGLRYDDRIAGHIASGEVAWYQLDPHTLEVD